MKIITKKINRRFASKIVVEKFVLKIVIINKDQIYAKIALIE